MRYRNNDELCDELIELRPSEGQAFNR